MSKPKTSDAIPLRIRDACAEGLEQAIPEIVRLATAKETVPNLRISAFDKLGKYGLAGRQTVLIEEAGLARQFLRVAHEVFGASEVQLRELADRLADLGMRCENPADPEETEVEPDE